MADIFEDCLLRDDFLSVINLEDVFKPFSGKSLKKKGAISICSRIQNLENKIPLFLRELFLRESKDFFQVQKDLFV